VKQVFGGQESSNAGIGTGPVPGELTTARVLCYSNDLKSNCRFHSTRSMQKPDRSPIGVLLADDADLVRSAVRRLFEAEPNIKLLGEAANFSQTLQMVADLKPNVVVLDLHMPDEKEFNPAFVRSRVGDAGAQLLAMSIWNDDEAQALAASYGAVALLDKATIASILVAAILQLA